MITKTRRWNEMGTRINRIIGGLVRWEAPAERLSPYGVNQESLVRLIMHD